MKRISLLGSTGSIGRQTLDIVDKFNARLQVHSLAAHSNTSLLAQQIQKYRPKFAVVIDEKAYQSFRNEKIGSTELLSGNQGLEEIVSQPEVDLVVDAVVGAGGLLPCLKSIEHGKDIALANKEVLVMAGELVTRLAREKSVRIIPIDSEHSGMLQCLSAGKFEEVEKLIITGSGGPFLNTPWEEFGSITVEQALRHPTWRMGKKITIDSATLMNKALEIIEAYWLFGIPAEKIEVLIHPQSVIHSLVEYKDGSVIAQMAPPDMRLPIEYALFYPDRMPGVTVRLDLAQIGKLTFFEPDTEKFRSIRLAYKVLELGGTAPAALNAANEAAVNLFLQKQIPFVRITEIIEQVLDCQRVERSPSLDDILNRDAWARQKARELAQKVTIWLLPWLSSLFWEFWSSCMNSGISL
ncbi:MAG: 1-deoxy-D-xylulose-5-phosphate reductoisomerase [candidate division Zixibacteria bacterium]|nr:1-deoxy-D-xylulose-5-phosphate reductoisomerase [candidate division Zixibacteria bacterium]